MFPLKVIIVGLSDNLLLDVRRRLQAYPAEIEAEFRNINDAVERWSWSEDSDPRLVVTRFRGLDDLQELQCVKRAFNWPMLTLVEGPRQEMLTLFILANRNGATQLVPMPLDEEDFRAAMESVASGCGFHGGNAKVIAVSGVTGGSGATTVAINLASEIAHLLKMHTILVELSLQKGMLGTYLNVEPSFTIPDLFTGPTALDLHMVKQALTTIAPNFDILTGAHHAIADVHVQHRDVLQLLDYLRRLCQVLVLDVPCTLDDSYLQTLSSASQVILVAEQNLPSLRSLKLVLEMLGRANLNRESMSGDVGLHVVLNRYNPNMQDFDLAKLKELLRLPTMLTIANDYNAVNAALLHGMPLRVEHPRSRALADVDGLVRRLFGGTDPADKNSQSKGWNLFSRLARAFGRS